MSMKTRFEYPYLLTIIVLLAAALRFSNIQMQSIWFDEGYSWWAAIQPDLMGAANADATNPPLYYMLLHIAVSAWGDSEFSLRLLSLLISLPIIPLAAHLARRITPRIYRDRAAIFTALIAAVLPALTWAAQEARMYTLLALLVLIAAVAWDRLLHRPQRAAWIALWLTELALLYAHNASPVIVLWLNVMTLIVWLVHRSLKRPDARLWIVGQIGIALLWLPYFITRFLDLAAANAAITSAPSLNPAFFFGLWMSFWVIPFERIAANADSLLIFFAFAVLLIGLIVALPHRGRWIAAHVLILSVGLALALIVLGNEFHGRYLVMMPRVLAPAPRTLATRRTS